MEKKPSVLVIDDEKDFCNLINLLLKKDRFQILCSHTLDDAKIKLAHHHPDVVLLDHNLPDGTGLDFFINNKNLFEGSQIILITADPSPAVRTRATAAGIQFLSKPVELKKIKDFIRQVA